jgi:hypothetical protein
LALQHTQPDQASELAAQAVSAAFAPEQGPTVNLIGVAIGIACRALGVEVPGAEQWLAWLETQLPLAQPRIEWLRAALASSQSPVPMDLLRAALPFNFR